MLNAYDIIEITIIYVFILLFITRKGVFMFPEYRDLISRLKNEDAHFARLFEEHNALDHQIIRLEQNPVTSSLDEIDTLKKQKLALKDQLYVLLKKADAEK